LATSSGVNANMIGISIGLFIPSLFYDEFETDKNIFQEQTNKYLWANAIITTCACIPVLLLMKEKPRNPTSNSEFNKEVLSFMESLKLLIKNKSFIYLLLYTAGIMGYFNVYGTIINEVFDKYGITANETSLIGTLSMIGGIISSIVLSVILDKTKSYKKVFVILNLFSILFHILMSLSMEIFARDNVYILTMIFWVLINVNVVPVLSIFQDYACELTYPVGIKNRLIIFII